jgi:hypothetical protein
VPPGWIPDALLAVVLCAAATPIVVFFAAFPGNPDETGLTRVVLSEIVFSAPFSAVAAGAIAAIVYGAAAPADRLADPVRARWAVVLSMTTGLWLFSMGCISILHSVYHPHGQSI